MPALAERPKSNRLPRTGGFGKSAAALAGYSLLSLAVMWPLPARVCDAVPLGSEPAATVPVFNLWSVSSAL